MLKKRTSGHDINYIIEHATYTKDNMNRLYNRLQQTTYIPKEELLLAKTGKSKSFNHIFIELNTIFKEVKNKDKKTKNKKLLQEAEQVLSNIDFLFMKIKNIKVDSIESLGKGYSLDFIVSEGFLDDSVMTDYLSANPESFIQSIQSVNGREFAYQRLITTFLEDIEDSKFVLEEMQTEIAKNLAFLSKHNPISIEEIFWKNISSNIAKHYIVPVFIKRLIY